MKNATNGRKPAGRIFWMGLPVLLAAGLSACQSTTPAADQMSRTTLETAPADLQLLCASAAAQARNLDSSQVLPVSSRKLDARHYQVDLNAAGTTVACTVDSDGMVRSMTPA